MPSEIALSMRAFWFGFTPTYSDCILLTSISPYQPSSWAGNKPIFKKLN